MRTRWRGRHSKARIVMVAAMLGAVCAMVWLALVPARYSATTTVVVGTTGTYLTELRQQDDFAEQLRRSYAAIATTPIVLEPVIERLHLATSAASLAERISVRSPADTALLEVSAVDASPARAAAIADAVAKRLQSAVAQLTPKTDDAAPITMRIVEGASAPWPLGLPLAVLLGLGAGALAGALGLAARAAVRRRPPPGGGSAAASLLPGV